MDSAMIMKEIPTCCGYFATEDGHIFSSKSNKILAEQEYSGYLYASINGRPRRIHRMVALAFIPNPNNYPCINHKDEDKHNNSVENLEWCTYKYNNNYGKGQPTKKAIKARKKPVVQLTLDGEYVARYESASEAERVVRNSPKSYGSNISALCRKSRSDMKTAYGYKWMFEKDYIKQIR